jgi:hypothetical protein
MHGIHIYIIYKEKRKEKREKENLTATNDRKEKKRLARY